MFWVVIRCYSRINPYFYFYFFFAGGITGGLSFKVKRSNYRMRVERFARTGLQRNVKTV